MQSATRKGGALRSTLGIEGPVTIDAFYRYYFSGSQCRIFFNGIYIAEVNYIEYTIRSNKAPIYAYNDPYYKLVARGNYLVEGSFNLNLRDRDYLLKVREDILGRRGEARPTTIDAEVLPLRTGSDQELLKFMEASSNEVREGVIQKYISAYWGIDTRPGPREPTRPDEWDLTESGDINPNGFDIVMVFGVPGGPTGQFTTKQINDVHITGEGSVVDWNGQGIITQYPFFARKVDGEQTTFHPHQSSVDEPVPDIKDTLARKDWPIIAVLNGRNETGGGNWEFEILFDTRNRGVGIKDVRVGKIIRRFDDNQVIETDKFVRAASATDPAPNTMYVYSLNISSNVSWVEYRDVVFTIYDVGSSPGGADVGIEFETTNIDATRISVDNLLRVKRPVTGALPQLPYH